MPSVILASASPIRRALLEQAGVTVTTDAAAIDEATVKSAFRADAASADACAEALAELKAKRVSSRHPAALVIGADQMLDFEGAWFDKPADLAAARAQLQALRGRTHRLISAVVVVRDGQRLWHTIAVARLTMRLFSEEFLEEYLHLADPAILSAVGAYQLEGRGVQLFEQVEGDYFTVLGLPLLPLLAFLRGQGVISR
jgi:septum formation protein